MGLCEHLNCLAGKTLYCGFKLCSFPLFLFFMLTWLPCFDSYTPPPPLFMLIKSSDTEQERSSRLPERRRPDKGCHKCWSQNNWWIRELKPKVLWSGLLREKLFFQFLFTRSYLCFIVTVYLPGTQRHKYLVNGFRRPYCVQTLPAL